MIVIIAIPLIVIIAILTITRIVFITITRIAIIMIATINIAIIIIAITMYVRLGLNPRFDGDPKVVIVMPNRPLPKRCRRAPLLQRQHLRPFLILIIVRPRIFESKFRDHCAAKKLDGTLRKPTSFV